MKKTFLITLFVLFCTICFGQSYTIKSDGVEFVVADYAKEIIEKNISVKSGYNYEFELLQDGDSFAVSYIVNPGNLTGRESTDDLWNEIEQTIMRAMNAMNKQISNTPIIQENNTAQEPHKNSIVEKQNTSIGNKIIASENDNSGKKTDKMFLGVNAGLGLGFANSYTYGYGFKSYGSNWAYFTFNAGADFTYLITKSFSVGAYLSIGLGDESYSQSMGALVKYDLYNESAVIGGAGLNIQDFEEFGANVRVGYKTSGKFYFMLEMATASYYSYGSDYDAIGFLIHVGYSIF